MDWDFGETRSFTMAFSSGYWAHSESFFIPQNSPAVTYGAGITINYGRFSKRVAVERILMAGTWADGIADPDLITGIQDPNTTLV